MSHDLKQRLIDRYPDDALQRLVAANPDYYNSHGNYLPELAQLLLFERAEVGRLQRELETAEAERDGAKREALRLLDELQRWKTTALAAVGGDPE